MESRPKSPAAIATSLPFVARLLSLNASTHFLLLSSKATCRRRESSCFEGGFRASLLLAKGPQPVVKRTVSCTRRRQAGIVDYTTAQSQHSRARPARQARVAHRIGVQQTEQSRDSVLPLQDHPRLGDASQRASITESRGQDRMQDPEHNDGAWDAGWRDGRMREGALKPAYRPHRSYAPRHPSAPVQGARSNPGGPGSHSSPGCSCWLARVAKRGQQAQLEPMA